MFLGMPGLNGDSYPASQVRNPSSFLFYGVHGGAAGTCATARAEVRAALWLPSSPAFRWGLGTRTRSSGLLSYVTGPTPKHMSPPPPRSA